MLSNKRILLIEDDEDLRIIFSAKLEDLNSFITIAHSGNEAISLLENDLKIDFIISDYSMPDGNGPDVLNYVAHNNLSVPFVFYTSNINPDIPIEYEHFLGTIHKFNFDQLLKVIIRELAGGTRSL
ncbi:MAG: response regulator [Bacteriovoracaceae bacterium]